MSVRKLRWGLLAPAGISRSIIPAIRASANGEIVAVSSRDLRRAEAFAETWKIPRTFGSYEELLADPGVDVVYVAVPQALHAEWAVRAADAGKHVLVEKPMATSVEDVDRISAASMRTGVVVLEAMMFRYHPQIRRVQELVREGSIGDIRLIRSSFSYPMSMPDGEIVPAILDPDLGGGSLWDVGCYPVSFAQAIVGSDPVEVTGMETTGRSGVDLAFVGGMKYGNAVFAQFDCSFIAPLRWSAEIVGALGSIHLDEPWNHRPNHQGVVTLKTTRGDEVISLADSNAYQCEVEALAACVLDGTAPPLSLSQTRGTIATMVALHESSRRTEVLELKQEETVDG